MDTQGVLLLVIMIRALGEYSRYFKIQSSNSQPLKSLTNIVASVINSTNFASAGKAQKIIKGEN